MDVKFQAVRSSETLLSAYKSTLRYNPEDNANIFTSLTSSNRISGSPVLRRLLVTMYGLLE